MLNIINPQNTSIPKLIPLNIITKYLPGSIKNFTVELTDSYLGSQKKLVSLKVIFFSTSSYRLACKDKAYPVKNKRKIIYKNSLE